MDHMDKFPPTAFLLRTMFKTPERLLLICALIFGSELCGLKWFPHQTADIVIGLMYVFVPTIILISIWMVVWIIKNPPPPLPPAPPVEYCEKCHQALPPKDNNEQQRN